MVRWMQKAVDRGHPTLRDSMEDDGYHDRNIRASRRQGLKSRGENGALNGMRSCVPHVVGKTVGSCDDIKNRDSASHPLAAQLNRLPLLLVLRLLHYLALLHRYIMVPIDGSLSTVAPRSLFIE
jgi:hypothetical protein